jgi:hypothetical protein
MRVSFPVCREIVFKNNSETTTGSYVKTIKCLQQTEIGVAIDVIFGRRRSGYSQCNFKIANNCRTVTNEKRQN